MTFNTYTDTIGLREFTDQELAGVSGGETVVEAVRNAVCYIGMITYGGRGQGAGGLSAYWRYEDLCGPL
jgi:hypothetical protein